MAGWFKWGGLSALLLFFYGRPGVRSSPQAIMKRAFGAHGADVDHFVDVNKMIGVPSFFNASGAFRSANGAPHNSLG